MKERDGEMRRQAAAERRGAGSPTCRYVALAGTALPMTIPGSTPGLAGATRVMEPWRVWVGSSFIGVSTFRNLRPGQPTGYGIGKVTTSLDLALMPCARLTDIHHTGARTGTVI